MGGKELHYPGPQDGYELHIYIPPARNWRLQDGSPTSQLNKESPFYLEHESFVVATH